MPLFELTPQWQLPVAFVPGISASEVMVLALIGLLLYGKRLPDVAKSVGKSVLEFKKGLQSVRSEFDATFRETAEIARTATSMDVPPAERPVAAEQREKSSVPRFEPPRSEPSRSEPSPTVVN